MAEVAAGAGSGQPRMLLLVALQAAVEAGDADRCCRVLLAAARGLAAEGHRREAQRVLNLAQAHLGAKDCLRADLAAAWREFEQEESNA
ncbi:hypothetical protein JQS43_21925 [Natronosporangium hydrolyticum]|uniref:Uncharacterized protein n=1 Tax=Natronosporangium hydrolyticum TaxID=2811111 RepID=A0A895YD75_9ACTN|nr:hypothetical protein [Natronosporangium hydrolyticum]QSB14155.1 hypothetical protein JQS43_21925 [Natronosporangium hydrolyticum]